MTPLRIENKRKNYAVTAFLWGLITAAIIITPIMICDKGYFLYFGDFNVQEIPFYRLAHDAILSGRTGWDHLTDLGANFVGSYSFYLLGSPFFYLTLLLPSTWVAYAIGPLLALKLGCASLTAYLYLRRYVRDRRYAVIGGILYAFSGFSVYNIFFFHFHEAIIVFPLLLAALDEFHYQKRRGVFALAAFAAATVNYYFFFGQVVFVVIYYIIKLITKSYRFRLKEFFLMAAESVIGFLMSMALLLPSIAAITGNYRVSEIINGWGALLYSRSQRYIQILIAFFFPGDLPSAPNFTPNAGGKWSSVALYIPMFSMVYVIAYLRQRKRSFLKILFFVLLIMALVPVLNSSFQAMNSAYYARWYYMLTLVMALITIKCLDDLGAYRFRRGFIPTIIITAAITLLIGLTPYESFRNSSTVIYKAGVEENPKVFWLFAGITIVGLALTLLLYLCYRKKQAYFIRLTALALSLFIIGYSEVYLWCGKAETDDDDSFMINYALNDGEDLTLSDINEVRSDFYNATDNIGMFWHIPNIQTFHSIVPASLMEFYNQSGEQRDVASRPSFEHYGFRPLLSVKYCFIPAGEPFVPDPEEEPDEQEPLMPGYRYLRTENGFDIYENDYYLPMGFTYDRFICEEEYKDTKDTVQHLTLLKAMVLTRYQMDKYRDITGYTDGMYLNLIAQFDENHTQNRKHPEYVGFDSITAGFDYSEEAYYQDAEALKQHTCSSFRYTDDGFEAEYDNTGDDNLLFFSVPYDEGWSATVNGEPAEIERVNIGFMAVKVGAKQKSTVHFTYHTPLLKEGMILSIIGYGCLIIYLIIQKGFGARQKRRIRYIVKQKSTGK